MTDATPLSGAVAEAARELNKLSSSHYAVGLGDLLGRVETPEGRRQYARLLGVMVKQPFANEVKRRPSESTRAVIALRWKEDDELRRIAIDKWQFAFMREIMSEAAGKPLTDEEAFNGLTHYKYESSLGKFIFEAFRDRICGDAKTSKAVREALAEARRAGIRLADPTAAGLSVGAASVVAVALGGLLPPALVAVGSPVIGGVALLIFQIGIDGFCRWSRAVIEESAQVERAEG